MNTLIVWKRNTLKPVNIKYKADLTLNSCLHTWTKNCRHLIAWVTTVDERCCLIILLLRISMKAEECVRESVLVSVDCSVCSITLRFENFCSFDRLFKTRTEISQTKLNHLWLESKLIFKLYMTKAINANKNYFGPANCIA